MTHDDAGRMTGDAALSFTWDAFSSLAAVKTSGSLTEALQYHGLGRLVARYDGAGALKDEYIWDGDQMVACRSRTNLRGGARAMAAAGVARAL
ncbi:MAG: hypothetical protein IT380_25520 [Myxococcales bacterium]|nr:hypothetical protein [Myxococcales bacterium]